MEGVLKLHQSYDETKASLIGKQPRVVAIAVPEAHPLLGKYTSKLDYDGKVAGSCIHCHQIQDTRRQAVREAGEVLSHKTLTPWPMPSAIGFEMDPKSAATVSDVLPGSHAGKAGLDVGDVITDLDGQPILSLADIQWVLHHITENPDLVMNVRRGTEEKRLVLPLGKGWDLGSDIDWRVSTWDLRRMALGGMRLVSLSDEEREEQGVADGKMALFAKNVGQYGNHAVAKKAGLKKGDVIVSFDGDDSDISEGDLLRRVLGKYKRGEEVSFTYLRNGAVKEATIRLQ
jgi:serine protease Do